MDNEYLYLVAFFKFSENPEHGFKRIDLQGIFKTEEDAMEKMTFCDEAGWYEGVLIERRKWGNQNVSLATKYRFWFIEDDKGEMIEIEEPSTFKNCINLIG